MIIYTDRCLECFHKKRLREIKDFCIQHGLKYQVLRISYNKDLQVEAHDYVDAFSVTLPFIIEGHKAIELYGNLEYLL